MNTLKAVEHIENNKTSPPTCGHCGEACTTDTVIYNEQLFCCNGCQLVFELLQSNELSEYYQLEQQPGINKNRWRSVDYSFLDDNSILEQLIDYQDTKTIKLRFHLPQIHCISCVYLLEHFYKLLPGIQHSRVNFIQRSVAIAFDPSLLTLREVVEMLAKIGYPPELQLHQLEEQKESSTNKKFYYQLGIAGFAFGNIMLMSFPDYLGSTEGNFATIFGYLNLLLSLPVLFYSASDYWQSAYWSLHQRQVNIDVPITIGMFSLFGRSVYEILTYSGTGYLDSLAGLVFFLLIGKWFQQRTYNHLSFERDYKSYFPIAVLIKEGEQTKTIALSKLKKGTTIIVKNEELIPADGLLTKGNAQIDYSFVTGEATPVTVGVGDRIFAGGKQLGAAIEVLISKEVSQSYLTQLWNDTAFGETANGEALLANQIGKIFTYAILSIAFATVLYWLPIDSAKAINAFTAVLIVACPCAVALSIPFTYGNMLRWFSQQSIYFKNINVIDQLQRINTIIFDKTGTITETQRPTINYLGSPLSNEQLKWIKTIANQSSHTLSRQLTASLNVDAFNELSYFKEFTGQGIKGTVASQHISLGKLSFLESSPQIEQSGTVIHVEINGQYLGCFQFSQPLRKGLKKLFRQLHKQYELYLLSGDNNQEAARLVPIFNDPDHLHFNQSPQDKLNFIKELQNSGKKIMMIGDGLNDAGALKQSDVGLVVTENINNFSPACDGILNADQLFQLQSILNYTKKGKRIVMMSYVFAAIYNIIGLIFAVTATLSPVIAAVLMPLSSITIVAFGVSMSAHYGRVFISK